MSCFNVVVFHVKTELHKLQCKENNMSRGRIGKIKVDEESVDPDRLQYMCIEDKMVWQSDHSPPSKCFRYICTCTVIRSSTIQLPSNHKKCISMIGVKRASKFDTA